MVDTMDMPREEIARLTESDEEKLYIMSKHAQERYAQRILGKEDVLEIRRYITEHEEKIKKDVSKMITTGQLLYTGKQQKNTVKVFRNGCWIVLVDPDTDVVITLYKVMLGAGEEFDKQYVERMAERIAEEQEKLEKISREVDAEAETCHRMAEDAEVQIAEYRGFIKNLEALVQSYRGVIDNGTVRVRQQEREVAEVVNKLIGKKEF